MTPGLPIWTDVLPCRGIERMGDPCGEGLRRRRGGHHVPEPVSHVMHRAARDLTSTQQDTIVTDNDVERGRQAVPGVSRGKPTGAVRV